VAGVDQRRRPAQHELRVRRLVARQHLEAERVWPDAQHRIERLVLPGRRAVLQRQVLLLRVPHLLADALAARDQVREVVGAIGRLPPQVARQHVAHREQRVAHHAGPVQPRREVDRPAAVGRHDHPHRPVGRDHRAARAERDRHTQHVGHAGLRSRCQRVSR
jgi:hypothetical protein